MPKRRIREISVAIGVPRYGKQAPDWWVSMMKNVWTMGRNKVKITGIRAQRGINVDQQRNGIVEWFRKDTNADYLWFVDDDTVPPDGAVVYLASLGSMIASGLYYARHDDGTIFPIAYRRKADGRYNNISQVAKWKKGQVLEVDAVGAGMLLVHRKVFDDIEDKYQKVCRMDGGADLVLKSRISGTLPKEPHYPKDHHTVFNGVMRNAVYDCSDDGKPFPFFVGQYGRTEDLFFFERAKAIGYKILVDTSVESGHIKESQITGDDFREQNIDVQSLMDSLQGGFRVQS